ncbi:carboxypeptidase-like regulatory domain-containing protein [Flavobacteriaceae bacterium]|nr:carboxypeptidase-like regulatory domain-containing protein [Flavobacteriaceae bacterium]MDC3040501.1 carboxypeptidase-like regulatory domain-containing protein [Flavobacteriaceae bacterium]|tara:strand:- start:3001 stop:5811 length:2811 start_codon:yes stop_codon:yes gene_type:complete
MKKTLIALILLSTNFIFSQSVITGKVIDGEFNELLPFANVLLLTAEGENIDGTSTDFDGAFTFEVLKGTYILEFSFVGYDSKRIIDVIVGQNEEYTLTATLLPASNSLDEVIVTTTAKNNTEASVLLIQKRAVNLIDGLSAQSIQKTGDSDLASAIKRIPGVSVQDGKFVYVRGLGDRYSKTLLGGLEVPGLDPDKNTLQLDIFPTNLLDNILISKSASADLNSDFTGGIVDVILKDFSVLPEYSFSIRGSYNPDMNLNDNFIGNENEAFNFLGFDNGYFDNPLSSKQEIPFPETFNIGQSVLTRFLTQKLESTMDASRFQSFLNYSIGATASNQYNLSDTKSIGYIASLSLKRDYEYYESFFNGTVEKENINKPLEPYSEQVGEFGQVKNLGSALLGISLKTTNSKYKLNLLAIKSGESGAIKGNYKEFIENPYNGDASILTYTDRNILSLPFSSQHIFNGGNSSLDIKIAPSIARVYDKDFKKTVFEIAPNGNKLISPNTTQNPTRLWRSLKEDVISSKIQYNLDLKGEKIQGKIKFGSSFTYKQRDFETDDYRIAYRGLSSVLGGDANNILASNFIYDLDTNQGSYIKGDFQRTNQYESSGQTFAGYISSELILSDKWKSTIGLRFENYLVKYTGENIEAIKFNNEKLIDTKDLYPSLNVIRTINDDRNLRISYSKTTARPTFKEISAAQIYDPITERYFVGNPDVNPTYINNFDLRYESYSDGNQIFAISTFYKQFSDPIEITAFDANQPSVFIVRNNEEASVYGIELEYRKDILNNDNHKLSLNLNTSVIQSIQTMSEAEYQGRLISNPDKEIDESRELQGQSPYLINLGLVYNLFEKNIEIGSYYNVQGKTLEVVGIGNLPDVYTLPFHNLNINVSKSFGKNLDQSLTFKAENLLNSKRESEYDYYNIETSPFSIYNPGQSFSLGYSIKF